MNDKNIMSTVLANKQKLQNKQKSISIIRN